MLMSSLVTWEGCGSGYCPIVPAFNFGAGGVCAVVAMASSGEDEGIALYPGPV